MWIYFNNGHWAICKKQCKPGELLIRARRKEDILQFFPDADIKYNTGTDYEYRAGIPVEKIAKFMHDYILQISYPSFKKSAKSHEYHSLLNQVWAATLPWSKP